jgi:5'-3' exonuclease
MIIFDFNQVAISSLMEQIGSSKKPVEESLVRHMILNVIRTYVKKFKTTHGPEVVIACDNKHYWRRDIFPQYKASRKKNRDASGHDWASIFECLHKIKEELKEYSPYKVVDVDTCEADDIIAVLSTKYAAHGK